MWADWSVPYSTTNVVMNPSSMQELKTTMTASQPKLGYKVHVHDTPMTNKLLELV